MTIPRPIILLVLLSFACASGLVGAEQPPVPSELEREFGVLGGTIQAKLRAGKTTEAELQEELRAYDRLVEKYAAENSDEIAYVIYMQALLYGNVIGDAAKSQEILRRIKRDFPQSAIGRAILLEGEPFPLFREKDLTGAPLDLESYRGKVVLIDFWATWCQPCLVELPHVLRAYQEHHADGFEIIGISLDSERARLERFIEAQGMPWQQYFDGAGWENKLAADYGVRSIPATFLLDQNGDLVARDLRGPDLERAVARLLGKE